MDRTAQLLCLGGLLLLGLTCCIAAAVLAVQEKKIPDVLVAILFSAAGALAGAARPPGTPPEGTRPGRQ